MSRTSNATRLVLALCTVAGCALGNTTGAAPPLTMPAAPPADLVANVTIQADPKYDSHFSKLRPSSLITAGRLLVIRSGPVIEGSLEVTLFKKGVNSQDPSVQEGIQRGLDVGARGFTVLHYGLVTLLSASVGQTQLYLWFPPDHNVMELFVMRQGFAQAGLLVRSVINNQLGFLTTGALS